MDRETIETPADGPSRMTGMVTGVRAGNLIFLSAIRGRNPETNTSSDDTREQAAQAFENIKTILASRGLTLAHVVKVTLYLGDLRYRDLIHEVWMKYFPENPPARTAMQVANPNASPRGNAHFVMDVVALAE
jgi:2-iminobutanoate/2-iminopropanoate deaminase